MTKHNISISIGGTNLGDNPSTTMNVTQWVGDFDDFVALCQKAWLMLTDEPTFLISCEDEDKYNDIRQVLSDNGFDDGDYVHKVGLLTDSDC